jgi:FtsP/CotA-like multicopper oxidase with cupredoxin domain
LSEAPCAELIRPNEKKAKKSGDRKWKDTIDLGPAQTLKIIMRFDGYKGRYVFHCHNLEHEDMAMMGNFEVI